MLSSLKAVIDPRVLTLPRDVIGGRWPAVGLAVKKSPEAQAGSSGAAMAYVASSRAFPRLLPPRPPDGRAAAERLPGLRVQRRFEEPNQRRSVGARVERTAGRSGRRFT